MDAGNPNISCVLTWLLMSFMCFSSNGRRQTENGDGISAGNRCLFSVMNRAMWGNWSNSSALTGTSAVHK